MAQGFGSIRGCTPGRQNEGSRRTFGRCQEGGAYSSQGPAMSAAVQWHIDGTWSDLPNQ
jgi:hypothetical protein